MKNKWLLPALRGVEQLWFLCLLGVCAFTQRIKAKKQLPLGGNCGPLL